MSNEPTKPARDAAGWKRAEVMAIVCERIAGGESMRQICAGDDMPDRKTVQRWIAGDDDIRRQYLDACRARTYHYAEEIIEIADDGINDTYIDPETGEERTNHDVIARSKLRVDARKWVMARMNRVDFGDKVTNELTGPNGGPIKSEAVQFYLPDNGRG